MTLEKLETDLRLPEMDVWPRPIEQYVVVTADNLTKLMSEVNMMLNEKDYDLVGGFSSFVEDGVTWHCQAMVKTMD